MSQAFANGQRWISMTEPDLGLGLIVDAENRRITINFPAAEEERTYAIDNAPLSRVRFEVGESISLQGEHSLVVRDIQEHNQCFVYLAEDDNGELHPIPEQLLGHEIQLHTAKERLLSGQLDDPKRFMLRASTLAVRNQARASQSRGILGARVDLIPHQFHIARQAAQREHPRLLLADEVGLGKTIEAGLILHQLHLDERVNRVLILVPDSLVNQWLVEMRRRFNLNFSVFDEERCQELDPSRNEDSTVFYDEDTEREREQNPFETEQFIIASIDWLSANPKRGRQLSEAPWDLLVIDEAHHLQWRENGEVDSGYALAETLCRAIPSVLLLTATPESTGIEGHFARLRLLDPDRYPSLAAFVEEQAGYSDISEKVDAVLASPDQAASNDDILALLGEPLAGEFRNNPQAYQQQALETLLDRFGTGRSLFRNSRSVVGGFPKRKLHEHPIDNSADGADTTAFASEDWPAQDARVSWLETFLLQRQEERALLICADAQTAIDLEHYLRLRRGVAASVFHGGMSLFERDRAAAYFADDDSGAQLLVCSEIGSEGRNFQFAEHLILFDLPDNPDLLEQRIGRLDRIGRKQAVHIHVPYFNDSSTARLLLWYRDALRIFDEPCTIGAAMLDAFGSQLEHALSSDAAMAELVAQACPHADKLRAQLHSGRNRLLELNSCRPEQARQLIASVETEQRGAQLADYLEQLADQFGLEHEDHSAETVILRPGDHMVSDGFPHLPADGITGTFSREKALSREDIAFFSWEHPLVRDAMEMIVTGDFGSACISTLAVKGLPAGSLLLEGFLNPGIQAPSALQLDRYLPDRYARVLIDAKGRELGSKVSHEQLNGLCQTIKRKLIPALLRQIREPLANLIELAENQAQHLEADWRTQALENYRQQRHNERVRLCELARLNPDVSDREVAHFDAQTVQGETALGRLQLNLNALRLAIIS
ncbi:RNA polymerase-associated protein RapA [Litorivivens sp.]|uniref:RNA polymerase-associated protein RapA n=1 Tax=Litorivivens sp. TaxID=2020868 RepID=UPI0035616EC0